MPVKLITTVIAIAETGSASSLTSPGGAGSCSTDVSPVAESHDVPIQMAQED